MRPSHTDAIFDISEIVTAQAPRRVCENYIQRPFSLFYVTTDGIVAAPQLHGAEPFEERHMHQCLKWL